MDRPHEPSDEALMQATRHGRNDAFETLLHRYTSPLLGFIRKFVPDVNIAEDLTQEVLVALWVKRHTYQPARAFRPWLFAIAVNRCRAYLRSLADHGGTLHDAIGNQTPPEHRVFANERAVQIHAALARLPERQRVVVLLRVWEGLAYADIAEVVGVSEATVRSHMAHALKALRQELQPHLD